MIEAPEARLLCEQLNKTVCGKRITDVFAQYTPHKFAWFMVNRKSVPNAWLARPLTEPVHKAEWSN